jgi:hypothetical protein
VRQAGRWGSGNRADVWRKWGTSKGGERLTGGPRQQCRAAVSLMSEARRAVGEGERSGAVTGRIGLPAGVGGGEAAACARRTWAGPGRRRWAEPK